ncbi:unnamed protein product [Cochlearia groenlandica]
MSGHDRISDLPESLITQILLHLPTKDTAKTSVLSTKWKNLWLKVPGLDLDYADFRFSENEQVFSSFIDSFLVRNPNSRLEKFKVNYSRFEMLRSTDLIESAISRGIRFLDLESNTFYRDSSDERIYPAVDYMPWNLYTSKTIVSLKLSFSGFSCNDPEKSFVVSMPCLRSMHLNQVHWNADTMNLEKLVLGCPVLEELTYVRALHSNFEDDDVVLTRVRSRSLKRLYVPFVYGFDCRPTLAKHTFEIDAPGLEYMSLREDHFDRIVLVKNLACLSTIDLNIKFAVIHGQSFDPEDLEKRNEIRNFLNGIIGVRHMIISHQTLKSLERYSKVGLVPKFNSLSRLEAEFTRDLLKYLPVFLESYPNLKHLILKILYFKDEETKDKLVGVPRCFDTTLECVEVKGFHLWEEDHEKKIASYFLENSAFLKKLTLSFRDNMQDLSNSMTRVELSKFKKRSRSCQVIVCNE